MGTSEDHCYLGKIIIKLANEKETYNKMRINALETVLQDYTSQTYIKGYEKYYRSLLSYRF